MKNKGLFIEKPSNARRFAVGDIHGCNLTLQTLVHNQLKLTKDDQLFLLGDYVNRGTDSWGVLEYLISLQKQGFQIYPLRGNHEVMLLKSLKMRDKFTGYYVKIEHKGENKEVTDEQQNWLNKLPYYYILDNFYLVHGAINTQIDAPLDDLYYMVWERETHEPKEFLDGKYLIHGHTVFGRKEIVEAVETRSHCIPIDNGCYKGVGGKRLNPEDGKLCALNLDTWELYFQNNMD
jgi:serine/threonine protein phosphatase 1